MSKANVSEVMRRWLEKMTAENPRDRFQSAQQALVALQQARTKPRWRPGWIEAVAGIAAASVTVLGAYIAHVDNRPPAITRVPRPPAMVERPGSWIIFDIRTPGNPDGVRVLVDGHPIEYKPRGPYFAEQKVHITAEQEGLTCLASPSVVDGARGQAVRVECYNPDCRSLPGRAPGYATIETDPPSTLYSYGRRVGESMLSRVQFPAGCVELVARTPEGREKTFRMQIDSGKVQNYRLEIP